MRRYVVDEFYVLGVVMVVFAIFSAIAILTE